MYTFRIKKKAVEMLNQGYPKSYIMAKLGLKSRTSLYEWKRAADSEGIDSLRGSGYCLSKYSKETKLEALKLAKSGNTLKEIQDKLNIQTHSIIIHWIKEYNKNKKDFIVLVRKDTQMNKKNTSEETKKLQEENKRLKAENAYLKKVRALIQKKDSKSKKK